MSKSEKFLMVVFIFGGGFIAGLVAGTLLVLSLEVSLVLVRWLWRTLFTIR